MPDLKEDLAALRLEREPDIQPRRRWVVWLVLAVFLIAAGGGAWWWFSRERPVEVETATVSSRQAGTQAAVLNATGYVTARRRATVSSKITGKVIEVNIEEGMAVRQGQVLARLDAETQRAVGGAGRGPGGGGPQKRQRKRGAPQRGADQPRPHQQARRSGLLDCRRSRRGACRRRLARSAHPAPPASRCGWPSARSRWNRPISTARLSARPLQGS